MIHKKTHLYQTKIDYDLIDAANVVYHPNYLLLCERARVKSLADAGCPFQELLSLGIAFAITECSCKYLRPITLGQEIAILTTLESHSGTRLNIHQKIIAPGTLPPDYGPPGFKESPFHPQKGEIFFQADFVLASVTLNPLKVARLSEKLIKALALQ
jgi:YbgC/YbaW family acyl-CoA thioester hydrolase